MGKGAKTAGIIIFIVMIVGLAYFSSGMLSGKTSAVFIKLTDPPSAPRGTQSINITYSSVMLHVVNSSASSWVPVSASGSADLMGLANSILTLARADVPSSSGIDGLELNITSAHITINGTSYPLTVPDSLLNTSVSGSRDNATSSIIISMSPTVVTIYTANSTLFVMVPSLRGVIVPGGGSAKVDSSESINATVAAALHDSAANISITDAAIAESANQTRISVTVKDNSGFPVVIRHVLVSGNSSVRVDTAGMPAKAQPSPFNITTSSLLNESTYVIGNVVSQLTSKTVQNLTAHAITQINASQLAHLASELSTGSASQQQVGSLLNLSLPVIGRLSTNLNSSQYSSLLRGMIANLTNSSYANSLHGYNVSALEAILQEKIQSGNLSGANLTGIITLIANANGQAQAGFAKRVVEEQKAFNYLNFNVNPGATMSMPSSAAGGGIGEGYTLPAGSSVTLSYDGSMTVAGGIVGISLINGAVYNIIVTGSDGAYASLNATAS